MQRRPFTEPGADPTRFGFNKTGQENGRLLHGGIDLGSFSGAELAAHLQVDHVGWLVITDCDCPYEETLFLYLFDRALALLDQCQLGGAYTPGILEGVEAVGPDQYRILFPSRAEGQLLTVAPRRIGFLRNRIRWLHLQLP